VPLSADDILQVNSGNFNATSGNATLSATTAGSGIILAVTTGGQVISTPPTGFTLVDSEVAGTRVKLYLYVKANASAGETSWSISIAIADDVVWTVMEVQNLDVSVPADVAISSSASSGSTIPTGTTATSTTYDGIVVAMFAHSEGATAPTISGHSGVTELDAESRTATESISQSVGVSYTTQIGTFTASASTNQTVSGTHLAAGIIAVFSAEGAKRAADLRQMWGMEWGTTAGLGTGNSANRVFETVNGSPAIVSTNPRTGSYCLELSASAAIENVQGEQIALPSLPTAAQTPGLRVCFMFPSSLPGADVDICSMSTQGSTVLTYRSSSQKIGLRAHSTGTEQLSDATVVADQWIAVDMVLYDAGAEWRAEWQVTYDASAGVTPVPVTQTTATFTTASVVGTVYTPILGWTASSTATIRYDDVACSIVRSHYPLGDHRIIGLKADPSGTLTISGTSGNFQIMSANGTLAAWNAATALTRISDVPPTIGASADGFVQSTTATGDYVNIPMETYPATGVASIRGVKAYVCGWAASATAATIGLRAHDGSTEHTLAAAADVNFDASTTAPAWLCRMVRASGGRIDWTPTMLDALALRLGFSGDASPAIGTHAVLAEVAIQSAPVVTLFGDPDADLRVEQALDPVTGGIIGMIAYTPATHGATLTYEIDGVEQTPIDLDPATDGLLIEIDAPDMPTISRVTLVPDEGA
jgi:hypothetical protein